MPHTNKTEHKADTRSLDDPKGASKKAAPSSVPGCRPDVCELGDKWTKWAGLPNAECPRCDFATIDEGVAKTRRPDIKWQH